MKRHESCVNESRHIVPRVAHRASRGTRSRSMSRSNSVACVLVNELCHISE